MQASGGDASGISNRSSISTAFKVEETVASGDQDSVGMSEASSYSTTAAKYGGGGEEEDGGELELGLGLGLGSVTKPKLPSQGECCRILTAKDFPSMAAAARPSISGTKRAADSVCQEAGSNSPSCQFVGWPPIRLYRKNSLVNQSRTSAENVIDVSSSGEDDVKNNRGKIQRKTFFVKVNMDGAGIGRKVDLNAHASYDTLVQALEDMFRGATTIGSNGHLEDGMLIDARNPSKLLDNSSGYVLTYEDREGDWMLVGDVPWGMFLNTVKRLRIMRTTDANGLAPSF